MRLLVIEPGIRLWGSERAFLSSLPALIPVCEHLVIVAPPEAELIEELSNYDVKVEVADIGYLSRRGYISRIKIALHLIKICRKHRIDRIYLNQAGLCRVVHAVARLLKLPTIMHVRLVEDIPRCAALKATENAPIDLIFVSNDMQARYSEKQTPELYKRLFTVYDPYELGDGEDCLVERPIEVACVGRLAEMKGQAELIEALAICRDRGSNMDLHFIGAPADNDPYGSKLALRVEELGLQDKVVFLGYRSDATQYMRSCKLVAVPSRYETLGRVIYEAWEAGAMPMCSRDSGGAAEMLIASGGGMLYDGHSPGSIASALCEAASLSEQERCARVEKGRKWARENLCLSAYRGRLTGVLF